jgi:class 3 adenylate cyclase
MVGFTPLSIKMSPEETVGLLNEIFSRLDELAESYGLEKIRTIGDNYMVASGVPTPRPDHAQALADFALELCRTVNEVAGRRGYPIHFRVGINSGPVVAGVIGRRKFHYDVWGDAVNLASRMESHGVPDHIQIAPSTYELIHAEFYANPAVRLSLKASVGCTLGS